MDARDESGPLTPLPFARSFPHTPDVDEMVRAFSSGNYAAVRATAARVLAGAPPREVRAAALELVARTNPPRVSLYLLALTLALLVVLTTWAYRQP